MRKFDHSKVFEKCQFFLGKFSKIVESCHRNLGPRLRVTSETQGSLNAVEGRPSNPSSD
jgi:hypothetical protein